MARQWIRFSVKVLGAAYTGAQAIGMPSNLLTWWQCARHGGDVCEPIREATTELMSFFGSPEWPSIDPWRVFNVLLFIVFVLALITPASAWRHIRERWSSGFRAPRLTRSRNTQITAHSGGVAGNTITVGRDLIVGTPPPSPSPLADNELIHLEMMWRVENNRVLGPFCLEHRELLLYRNFAGGSEPRPTGNLWLGDSGWFYCTVDLRDFRVWRRTFTIGQLKDEVLAKYENRAISTRPPFVLVDRPEWRSVSTDTATRGVPREPEHPNPVRRDIERLLAEGEALVQERIRIESLSSLLRIFPAAMWPGHALDWRDRVAKFLRYVGIEDETFSSCSPGDARTITLEQFKSHVESLSELRQLR